ncbi:MAG: annexin [Candidatus Gastranaerophilales bacterium]|nr:annexin [Candidatus Gastranaerophilales bacterium]
MWGKVNNTQQNTELKKLEAKLQAEDKNKHVSIISIFTEYKKLKNDNDTSNDANAEELLEESGHSEFQLEDMVNFTEKWTTTHTNGDKISWDGFEEALQADCKNHGFNARNDSAYNNFFNKAAGHYEENYINREAFIEDDGKGNNLKGLAQFASNNELKTLAGEDGDKKTALINSLKARNDLLAKFYAAVDNDSTIIDKAAKKKAIGEYVTNGIANGSLDVNNLSMDKFQEAITGASGISLDPKDSSASPTEAENTEAKEDKIQKAAAKIFDATHGWGTKNDQLIAAMTNLNPEDFDELDKVYTKKYGGTLKDAITDDASFTEQKAYTEILKNRNKGYDNYDANMGDELAKQLFNAMDKWGGTDQDKVIEIMTKLSPAQMKSVCDHYQANYSQSLTDNIKGDFSGVAEDILLSLIKNKT